MAVPVGAASVCAFDHVCVPKLYVPGLVVMLSTLIACSTTLEPDSRTYSTLPSRLGTGDVAVPDAIRMPHLTVGVVPAALPAQPA